MAGAFVETVPTTTTTIYSTGRRNSLAAPIDRQASKGGANSSTTSVASSDPETDLRSSGDGAMERRKSRAGSEDGHSETSSNRRKLSKLFKGRRKRSQLEDAPPLPGDARVKTRGAEDGAEPHPLFQSEESLGLHKSVPSSLLTDDSDSEA